MELLPPPPEGDKRLGPEQVDHVVRIGFPNDSNGIERQLPFPVLPVAFTTGRR
jgi:hypothetical protein